MPNYIITGIKQIDRALAELEPKIAKKVIRQAIRMALKPIAEAVKGNVPVKTGLLRKSVKVRASARKAGRIGLRVVIGQGDFQGETFYGAFQEYGTSKMPGKGFMRRAFDAKADSARDQVEREIKAGIDREVAAARST